MKATKKDLKKLQNYVAGLRDLLEAGKWHFQKNDRQKMIDQLYNAESVIRTCAFLSD